MRKWIIVAVLALTGSAGAYAQVINSSTPIPDANVLLNFNGSGLDWVYAGPIGPNEWDLGSIQPASYRATEGWRVATETEWVTHPEWTDFITPGNPGGIISATTFYDHNSYIFASEYWGNFSHVDAQDFANGLVTDGVNGCQVGISCWVPETIYVRNTIAAVPEPEIFATMLAGLGLLGLVKRRRERQTA